MVQNILKGGFTVVRGTNISLVLDQKTILNNVTFQMPKGTITAFIGPSGAGKTSLIKCIANLYDHYTGTLLYDGIPVKNLLSKERAQAIGFIFQQFNLFDHFTVLENCSYALVKLHDIPPSKAQETVLEILHMLNMAAYKDCYPAKLSGGQQQRVAIARALCLQPRILLLDEPTSALDPQATRAVAQLLKKLCKDSITIGISSHDMDLVHAVADIIYCIEDGQIKKTN